jgi:predicted outer membrane repeat protein
MDATDDVGFADNIATGFFGGGAVYSGGTLVLSESVYVRNNKARSGGGVYGNASSIKIRGFTKFADNAADDSGGAIHAAEGTFVSVLGGKAGVLQRVEFTGNRAGKYGGAVFIVGEQSTMEASSAVRFAENSADLTGGAVVATSATSVTLRGETAEKRSVRERADMHACLKAPKDYFTSIV